MDVKPAQETTEPAYPDRKEYLRGRHMLGVTVLGAGMVMSACNPNPRTSGVPGPPPRLMGARPVTSGHAHVPTAANPGNVPAASPGEAPPRTPGKMKVEPAKLDPSPRLLGEIMVEPKPDRPAKQDPPRLPGVPPPPPS